MSWNYGEQTLVETNRMQLRERGFPDSDECPMPIEHTPTVEPWIVCRDDQTRFMVSPTAWISASETWEVKP